MNEIIFQRRIGPALNANGNTRPACYKTFGCPDIFELTDGDFAVIGSDITESAVGKLPPTAGCAANERIIRIPRKLLVLAKADIPDTV